MPHVTEQETTEERRIGAMAEMEWRSGRAPRATWPLRIREGIPGDPMGPPPSVTTGGATVRSVLLAPSACQGDRQTEHRPTVHPPNGSDPPTLGRKDPETPGFKLLAGAFTIVVEGWLAGGKDTYLHEGAGGTNPQWNSGSPPPPAAVGVKSRRQACRHHERASAKGIVFARGGVSGDFPSDFGGVRMLRRWREVAIFAEQSGSG